MNKNNIEVELKFRITDTASFKLWLAKHAKLQYTDHQVDTYYTPAHRDFFAKKVPHEMIRIRKSGEQYSINYKYRHVNGIEKVYSHCDEYETEVTDGIQLQKIFEALDFKPRIIVDKTRSSYIYNEFEIEYDAVKDLGIFCEIEIKGVYDSPESARARIMELANEMHISDPGDFKKVNIGYSALMVKEKGLLK